MAGGSVFIADEHGTLLFSSEPTVCDDACCLMNLEMGLDAACKSSTSPML